MAPTACLLIKPWLILPQNVTLFSIWLILFGYVLSQAVSIAEYLHNKCYLIHKIASEGSLCTLSKEIFWMLSISLIRSKAKEFIEQVWLQQ